MSSPLNPDDVFRRYQEIQQYVGWTDEDVRRVQQIAPILEPHLKPLIDDFYEEIDRHAETRKVITAGAEQVQRLKGTLMRWLHDLLNGPYDRDYVVRRWKAGWRHVEIGLDQVYTNAALSRLRRGLLLALEECWHPDTATALACRRALNTLLDLDLAIIEDAYQTEHLARQQRNERLATIGQVAGGVAHELRNPLNVVRTSVYYLLNARNPTAEKKEEHLKRIERHVTLADGVITALSNFARMPVPNLLPTSIAECVRETLEFNPSPQQIQVRIDLAQSLPAVLADASQLRIVFANLMRNAYEAMAPTGTGELAIRGQATDGAVDISVADSGTGIASEQLSQIMEPLYSTKARGLGLGLAIARAIVEKNKGSLRVSSVLGKGSTFTVRLQAAPMEERQA